jgi:hypothetical protein
VDYKGQSASLVWCGRKSGGKCGTVRWRRRIVTHQCTWLIRDLKELFGSLNSSSPEKIDASDIDLFIGSINEDEIFSCRTLGKSAILDHSWVEYHRLKIKHLFSAEPRHIN